MASQEVIGRPVIYTEEFIEREALLLDEWIKKPDNYFVNKFALERGYDYHLPTQWAKTNKTFSTIYARAKQLQEVKLMEAGLNGKHKEQMSKFVLINHHNYKDKIESTVQQDTTFTVKTVNYNDSTKLTDKRDEPIEIDVVPTFD